jgi:hypothetical protein
MQSFRSLALCSRLSSTISNHEASVKRGHFLLSSFELLVISSLLNLKKDGSADNTWKTDDGHTADLEETNQTASAKVQKTQQKPSTPAK